MSAGGSSKSRIPQRVKHPLAALHTIQARSRSRVSRQNASRCPIMHGSRIPLPVRTLTAMADMVKEEQQNQKKQEKLEQLKTEPKTGPKIEPKIEPKIDPKIELEPVSPSEACKLSVATEFAYRAMLHRRSMTPSVRGNRTSFRRIQLAHGTRNGSAFTTLDMNFKWQSGQQIRKQIQQKQQREQERKQEQLEKQQEQKEQKGQKELKQQKGQKELKVQKDQKGQKEQKAQKEQKEQKDLKNPKPLLLQRPQKSLTLPSPQQQSRSTPLKPSRSTLGKPRNTPKLELVAAKKPPKQPVIEVLRFQCSDHRLINVPTGLMFRYSDEMWLRQEEEGLPIELRAITSTTMIKVVLWMNRHRDEEAKEVTIGMGVGKDWLKTKVLPCESPLSKPMEKVSKDNEMAVARIDDWGKIKAKNTEEAEKENENILDKGSSKPEDDSQKNDENAENAENAETENDDNRKTDENKNDDNRKNEENAETETENDDNNDKNDHDDNEKDDKNDHDDNQKNEENAENAEKGKGIVLSAWEKALLGDELCQLVEVVLAADNLGIDTLTTNAAQYFCDLMTQKSDSETKLLQSISNNLAEVRQDMEKQRPILKEIMDQAGPSLSHTHDQSLNSLCSNGSTPSIRSGSSLTLSEDTDAASLNQVENRGRLRRTSGRAGTPAANLTNQPLFPASSGSKSRHHRQCFPPRL